ncbi:proteasome assembly chaperone family protein [Halosegnis marinus]|uniref:Proteasome assembly chaperone family protein n=1 Tax=Halosegnis marinus TaxID=3034023 RepID=A0ABD5ZR33_9EURY|nr:PAC2 family protein [Halosegnis sp. DT85]
MTREPSFEVVTADGTEPGSRLLVGTAGVGVAGLTAADHFVTHAETERLGHVRSRNLPDITPFTDGQPRHPIRLYGVPDADVTVLVSEVFFPVEVADPLADALFDWADERGIEETTVLHGAPFPHSETEHRVFHVATEAYRSRHFPEEEPDIGPLAGGFFDGVVGELLARSLDGDAPPAGVLVTPTHLPGPDFDAALRLLDALEPVYGIEVDESALRERAAETKQYYADLAERMAALQEGTSGGDGREYPGDRMYM